MSKLILMFFIVIFTAGCATTNLYRWGNYEDSLYQYYKGPGDEKRLGKNLLAIIDKAKPPSKPPPGIYAEYGYLLLKQGHQQQALYYFKKEQSTWPESEIFMDRIIASINPQASPSAETALLSQSPESK